MNIECGLQGFCMSNIEGDRGAGGNGDLLLQVPLVFRDVTTVVKPGLWGCSIDGVADTDGKRLRASAEAILKGYPDFGTKAKRIESRPVWLQPLQVNDSNPVIFELVLCRPPKDVEEMDGCVLTIQMTLTFTNLVRIPLQIKAILHPHDGVLHVESVRRRTKPGPILLNVSLLLVISILLQLWNLYQNKPVHAHLDTIPSEVVTTIAGVTLAFFGLSMTKIRSWVKTFGHLEGVVRYPEIHIDATVVRFFSSTRPTLLIATIVGLLLVLSLYQWSVPIPVLPSRDLVLFDRELNEPVDLDRLRIWDVAGNRIEVVCAPDSSVVTNLTSRRPLGYVTRRGLAAVLATRQFPIKYPGFLDNSEETFIQRTISGLDVPTFSLPQAERVLRTAACGTTGPKYAYAHPNWVGDTLEVRPELVADRSALSSRLEIIELELLRPMGRLEIWQKRDSLAQKTADALREIPGSIPAKDVVSLVDALWKEVAVSADSSRFMEEKDAIMSSILARGLVRSFGSRSGAEFSVLDVMQFVSAYQGKYGKASMAQNGFMPVRAQWEVLLEIERLDPLYAKYVHEAIVGTLSPKAADYDMQYLRAGLSLGVYQNEPSIRERREYFQSRWNQIQLLKIKGPDDVIKYIRENETSLLVPDGELRSIVVGLFFG